MAANRDEFLDRPAEPAGHWEEYPGLIAGKDSKAGGTWMGVTKGQRFAAITNYREPAAEKTGAPSRGHLVLDYLKSEVHPQRYLQQLQQTAAVYNGFNILLGEADDLWYFSNKENEIRRLTSGIYGLSNHLLDTPWPKVQKGKAKLDAAIKEREVSADQLLDLLGDTRLAPDDALPATGVPLEWERKLSAMFIQAPHYGTRASTVLLIDRDGAITFVERTTPQGNNKDHEVTYSFSG